MDQHRRQEQEAEIQTMKAAQREKVWQDDKPTFFIVKYLIVFTL